MNARAMATIEAMDFEANYQALTIAAGRLRGILDVTRVSVDSPESFLVAINEALGAASDYLDQVSEYAFQMDSHYKADTTEGDV